MYTNKPQQFINNLKRKNIPFTQRTLSLDCYICPVCEESFPIPQYVIENDKPPTKLFYDDICLVCANMASEETCSRINQNPILLIEIETSYD